MQSDFIRPYKSPFGCTDVRNKKKSMRKKTKYSVISCIHFTAIFLNFPAVGVQNFS